MLYPIDRLSKETSQFFGVIVFHPHHLFFSGKPQQQDYQLDDYGDDYDDYEGDEAGDRVADTAITDQVNFTNQGRTITVDKGTTISLPCYVDEFPSKISKSVQIAVEIVGNHDRYYIAAACACGPAPQQWRVWH